MKKIFLLILIISTFQSCIKPSVYSVVDNTLFSEPYKKPYFVITYGSDYEKEIADILVKEIKSTFKLNTNIVPNFQVFHKNSINSNGLKSTVENVYNSKGSDLLFEIDIYHIGLYGDIIQNFNFNITAFDFKINKEVWKSKVFSPTYGKSVNNTCLQFVNKLKIDKVL
jgi:hypothetical protein